MDAIHLAYSFGALDSQTGRMLTGVMTAVHLFTSLRAVLTTAATAQQAHNVATQTGVLWTSASVGATASHTAVQVVHNAVMSVATTIQAVYNAHKAAFLIMTGVGIGLVIAAAAAMAYFSSQTSAAADSLGRYNEEAARSPRSIRRSGDEESLRNRGVEY